MLPPTDIIRPSSSARLNVLRQQQSSPYVPYASNVYGVYRRGQSKSSNNSHSKSRDHLDHTMSEYVNFHDTRIGIYDNDDDDDDEEDEEECYETFDYQFTPTNKLHSETDSNKFISNKPTSILKKPPRKKQLQQQYQDRRQPVNYVSTHDINNTGFVPHSFRYSPISTPPRLRTLVTPPGPESYRYDSHLFASQLPSLDGWRPPLSFDTPGINPLDYRISSPSLYRFKPSPLSHYAIPSPKQKKPYIVVPRLHNVSLILSPQNSFIPDSRYSYLSTMAPAAIPGLLRVSNSNVI
ncbi:unnamed protein product [Didymodactylos carnosus]|uniref:Uncharacterized protein n=1 Tax=Didymodactylos carnosus TaxID=1234261 RepID=A0A8S2N2A7_9BILA|nr:unnamed protein product [Didymodactylos carnosus]CAF3984633.1 unnamed protein product [Didymodactylos carnosus]